MHGLASAVNEDLARFDETGYVMVRDVFPRAVVDRWRAQFLKQLAAENSRLLVDGMLRYPEFREAMSNPRLIDVLGTILGRPFIVTPMCSVDHNRFGYYHKDTTGLELAGNALHKRPDYRMIVLGLYLQENNEYGGGLRLVPGSHVEPDPYVDLLREKHDFRDRVRRSKIKSALQRLSGGRLFDWKSQAHENVAGEIDVPTRPGDALIWDFRTVHRASPNTVGKEGQPGGKVAMFLIFGPNNDTTMEWVELMKKSEMGPSHAARKVPQSAPDYIIT
jgi:hypothetical protein